jgi:hypothetical protein
MKQTISGDGVKSAANKAPKEQGAEVLYAG